MCSNVKLVRLVGVFSDWFFSNFGVYIGSWILDRNFFVMYLLMVCGLLCMIRLILLCSFLIGLFDVDSCILMVGCVIWNDDSFGMS